MKALNGNIAVEPFQNIDVKTQVRSGFAVVEQKHVLAKLKVIYGNKDGTIPAGSTVHVLAELVKQPWSTKVYETVDGKKFILMPEHFVLLLDS